jgi:hypothetical protein
MATDDTSESESTTKRSATKRSTAKKSAATSSGEAAEQGSSNGSSRGSAPRASAPKKMTAIAVAAEAARQLGELTGRKAEGVTALERTDDGWKVQVEVVEVRRIPETTDVLAVYEIDADTEGNLEGYRRLRRYTRGSTEDE